MKETNETIQVVNNRIKCNAPSKRESNVLG